MFFPFRKKVTVAVHDGPFHPDDVFAVAIISLYTKRPVTIFRTRDEKILAGCEYVCDVGGSYDPEKKRFDHHQEGWGEKRENGIVYSSAGLVWKEYGASITGSPEIAERIDKKIIQGIDAEDNGIQLYEQNIKGISAYTFGDYLFSLNPTFYEKKLDTLRAFKKSVSIARKALLREIRRATDSLSTEAIVRDIYQKTADKRVIVLDEDYSWERVISGYPEPLFVVRPVSGKERWMVKRVPLDGFQFKNRLDLPESWAGKRDEELQKITGVPDATFCHRSRFVAGAKSKEGAIRLAQLAVGQKDVS